MKYIIVGGVAGGASFACRLRRLDEFAEIKIYEKTKFVSYANCGLPYYISGVIQNKESLTLQTPQSLKARFNIDVFVSHEVVQIDKDNKRVLIKDLNNATQFYENYDKLILSPGSEAIKLTNNTERIFELKTVEDSYKIKDFVLKKEPKKAIIIGGGFIGLEIAENLKESNIDVTLIEGRNHVLANLDPEMASFVHHELRRNGINLVLNKMVKEIKEEDNNVYVKYDDVTLKCDLLIQAVGVRPNSNLAKDANLELGIRGTLKTDDYFLTSEKDIYAIGDAIALNSFFDDAKVNIALAGLANKEGRELASQFMLKKKNDIKPLGTSILKVFSLVAASTGLNEEQLKQKKINYEKIYLCPANHASYYPNASTLNIKVLFDKDNYQILGAQIVGESGVDKRIDVIALAIQAKLPIYELAKVELSYAPPFGSAKDPINMIGYISENLKNKLVEQFHIEDIESLKKDKNNLFIDVRNEDEYQSGHIDGAINIPLDELRKHLNEINKNKTLCINCQSALRSYIACRILSQHGFKCKHLSGGYRIYSNYMNDLMLIREGK